MAGFGKRLAVRRRLIVSRVIEAESAAEDWEVRPQSYGMELANRRNGANCRLSLDDAAPVFVMAAWERGELKVAVEGIEEQQLADAVRVVLRTGGSVRRFERWAAAQRSAKHGIQAM